MLEVSEKVPSMEVVIDCLLYEEKKSKDHREETETDHEGALAIKHKST